MASFVLAAGVSIIAIPVYCKAKGLDAGFVLLMSCPPENEKESVPHPTVPLALLRLALTLLSQEERLYLVE